MDAGNLLAACGLDCGECEIFKAPHDPQLARRIAEEYEQERHQTLSPDLIRCAGCHGDRTLFWCGRCRILHCCVDQKGLRYCSECPEFPCTMLEEWSKESRRYGDALLRLKSMQCQDEASG